MSASVLRDPSESILVARGAEHLRCSTGTALTRTDLASEREWSASLDCAITRTAGMNHTLGSFHRLSGARGVYQILGLWRMAGDRDYSRRDRVWLREVQAAVVPLLGGPLALHGESSPASLPPRVRQVLTCLLEGDADKQIARRMGLTRHTVNQYVKSIYRHFGVESRPALLARWVRRGFARGFSWGDEAGKR